MAKKTKVLKPQHFAQNALFALRCYYTGDTGAIFSEVSFYGNDFVPKVGFTTVYLKVLFGSKQSCFRDLNATGEQNFDRVKRAIEGKKLQMQYLWNSATCEDAIFAAICESLEDNGFLRLPGVTDIKNYSE